MKKKMRKLILTFVVLCLLGLGSWYIIVTLGKKAETLGELAYDENKRFGYTVYIKEDSKYVPYLVLTSDYNGQALLLRKELMDKKHVFNEDGYGYASYYKESSIDRFLNEEFIALLDPEIQEAIVDSEIVITAKESIGRAGDETEVIERKVFLLSRAELAFTNFGPVLKEGESLVYFRRPKNRIAYRNETPTSWWLRSPELNWFNVACAMDEEMGMGISMVTKENGVRPAFCLNNDLEVELREDIIEGRAVYVIGE